MKKLILIVLPILLISIPSFLYAQTVTKPEYVNEFPNSNHPQIAYWFLTPDILKNDKYLKDLDNMIDHTLFDFIFLDSRNGYSFEDVQRMHPIVEKIVARAHQRNIKIGIRAQVNRINPLPEELTERFISEAEVKLNQSGEGHCSLNAKMVRSRSSYKKEVFRVFVFKKTGDGFFDPSTFKEISNYKSSVNGETIDVQVKAGGEYNGYTAYVMAQFYYHSVSNFSQEAANGVIRFIDSYSDIPLDGVMLDEYSNFRIVPPWLMKFKLDNFRLRSYSLPMAKELETLTGESAAMTMFHMRYAPAGKPEIRMKAINGYMDLMRQGAMHVENAMYKRAKEVYGPNCFIAAHNTFHNTLISDEIWATGIKWWSIPRENGFSDEKTPLPTQMGIAMSYPMNVMYNMYYDYKIKRFTAKNLTDLRYGVRTFYHAFNDKQWGLGLDQPESYRVINPVESCSRLMNRFNPSLPEIKLLVIFGNEALQNWYPDRSSRGSYDINARLNIEGKTVQLWNAGYLNALVPTDLITEGKLKLDADNKPVLNGHHFDAVVFLYPEYSKEPTLKFLENYVNHGGKLMIEGTASNNFAGQDITERMSHIYSKSVSAGFSVKGISKLGISKNAIVDGCKNEDGSYVFTDIGSLRKDKLKTFKVMVGNDNYSADYLGFAAIMINPETGLQRFAGTGFKELKENGQVILALEQRADIFVDKQGDNYKITLKDQTKSNKILINKLSGRH